MKVKTLNEAFNAVPKTPEELVQQLNQIDDMLDDCWRGCSRLKGFKREANRLEKLGNEIHAMARDISMQIGLF